MPVGDVAGPPSSEPPVAAHELAHIDAQDQAKQADIGFTNAVNQRLYLGEQPVMGLTGEAALQAIPAAREAIRQAHEDATAGLDPVARHMLAPVLAERAAGWNADLDRLAAGQKRAALDATSKDRQALSLGEFGRYVLTDPARAETNLNMALSEVHSRCERSGSSPEQTRQALVDTSSAAWREAVEAALEKGELDAAVRLLKQRQDQFDPGMAAKLAGDIDMARTRRDAGELAVQLVDSQPAEAPDLPSLLRQAEAEGGGDPARADSYAEAVAAEYHRRRKDEADRLQAGVDGVQAYLTDPKVRGLGDIPQAALAAAPAQTREALAAYFAAGGHPESSDPRARAWLSGLAAHDPAAFSGIDPTGWASALDKDDYRRLLTDVQAARAGGLGAAALQQLHRQIADTASELIAQTPAASDLNAGDAFHAALLRRAELAQAASPAKPLGRDEIVRLGDELMLDGSWRDPAGRAVPTSGQGALDDLVIRRPPDDPWTDAPAADEQAGLIETAYPGGPPPRSPAWNLGPHDQRRVQSRRALLEKLRRSGRIDDVNGWANLLFGRAASPAEQRLVMDQLLARTSDFDLFAMRKVQAEPNHRISMTSDSRKVIDRAVANLPDDELGRRAKAAYRDAWQRHVIWLRP